MPISFNVAAVLSPLVAGQLADLAGRYPERFGHVSFLTNHPFAPPALMDGLVLSIAFIVVFFFLEEVSDS